MAPVASIEEEEAAMAVLRAELKAAVVVLPEGMVFAGDEEATLLRFLRARKLDVPATLKMLLDTLDWRRSNSVDELLIRPMEQGKMDAIRRHRPCSYVGFDRQGRPVFVDRPGITNLDKIWEAGCTDGDIWKLHISEMEYMGQMLLKDASARQGRTVDSITIIMDMSGLSMRHFTKQSRELFRRIVTTDSNNYPETNAGTYIVNASWSFQTIWKVVSSMVDSRTRAKVQVLGSKEMAYPILEQVIDPDVIPDFLGGRNPFDETRAEWAKKMDLDIASFAVTFRSEGHSAATADSEDGASSRPGVFKRMRRSLSRIRSRKSFGRKSQSASPGSSVCSSRAASDAGGAPDSPTGRRSGGLSGFFNRAGSSGTRASSRAASDDESEGVEESVYLTPCSTPRGSSFSLDSFDGDDVGGGAEAAEAGTEAPQDSLLHQGPGAAERGLGDGPPVANGSSLGAKPALSAPLSLGALGGDGASLSAAIDEVTDAISRVDAMIAKVKAKAAAQRAQAAELSLSRGVATTNGIGNGAPGVESPGDRGRLLQPAGGTRKTRDSGQAESEAAVARNPGCRCAIQ